MFAARKRKSCHMCGETSGELVQFGDYYFCSFECFEKFANSIPIEEFNEIAKIDAERREAESYSRKRTLKWVRFIQDTFMLLFFIPFELLYIYNNYQDGITKSNLFSILITFMVVFIWGLNVGIRLPEKWNKN
jgi:hypothetical protein